MKDSTLRAALFLALLALIASPIFFGQPKTEAGTVEVKKTQIATAETGGADIFAADIEVAQDGILRAWVGVDTAGIISVVIKNKHGTVLDTLGFDKGVAILADTGRVFDWKAQAGTKYNYQTDTSADVTIHVDLVVEE